jgi:hypothetical protein
MLVRTTSTGKITVTATNPGETAWSICGPPPSPSGAAWMREPAR